MSDPPAPQRVEGDDGRAVEISPGAMANGTGPEPQPELTAAARKPVVSKNSKGLQKAFNELGYDHRYNLRSHQFQVRHYEDPAWRQVHDRNEAEMRELIADRFQFPSKAKGEAPAWFGRTAWEDSVNALASRTETDPFLDYLEDVASSWDQIARLHMWMRTAFKIDDDGEEGSDQYEIVSWASRALLLGAVARAYSPGHMLQEMVVLIGPQGCGKSTAIQWLLPPDNRYEWFNDGLHLASDRKEQAEALQGMVFVEASEMAGTNRAELEALKGFISRVDDRVRLAWRRNPESMPRRAVIVGTTNDNQPLPNDPSGNRRFIPVVVGPCHGGVPVLREYLDYARTQLWAEAVWMWKNQAGMTDVETPHFPERLKKHQKKVAEQHRRSDEMLENKLDAWLTFAPPEGFDLALAAVGCELIDHESSAAALNRRDALRLAAALRLAGYEKQRPRVDGTRTYMWKLIE